MSNSAAYQPYMMDTSPAGEPSWTLRVEGKVLGPTSGSDIKFSNLIKSIVIQLDENSNDSKNIIEVRNSHFIRSFI